MIEKLVIQKLTIAGKKYEYPDTTALVGKINELVDAVNVLKTKVEIVEECIHPTAKVDPYAEQRKWIGCLVRYKVVESCQGGWYVDVLDEIRDRPIYPFQMRNGDTAEVCELVTQDEIYPNKARTW